LPAPTSRRKLKNDASRACSSAAVKAVLAASLSDYKRFVKTQYAIGLSATNGKPRCDAAAFVAKAGGKARVWWNQSGNLEAAKIKSAWFEAAKKRAAAGFPLESPRRSSCLLPLLLCKPLALAVVLKTALSCNF
jgi:hypothetical protein